jgi:hypothetical protein
MRSGAPQRPDLCLCIPSRTPLGDFAGRGSAVRVPWLHRRSEALFASRCRSPRFSGLIDAWQGLRRGGGTPDPGPPENRAGDSEPR